jgi:hypothetical protein
MFEHWQSFEDYVKTYAIERSEAVLLRHISEVLKVLSQTVPPSLKSAEILEAEGYLEDIVRGVDSSLIDEWETMRNPSYVPTEAKPSEDRKPVRFTRNRPAFLRALRTAIFDLIKAMSQENGGAILRCVEPADLEGTPWNQTRVDAFFDEYFIDHQRIRLDPEARASKHTRIIEDDPRKWLIEQVIVDPDELNDWVVKLLLDLDQCDAANKIVLTLCSIESSFSSPASMDTSEE